MTPTMPRNSGVDCEPCITAGSSGAPTVASAINAKASATVNSGTVNGRDTARGPRAGHA